MEMTVTEIDIEIAELKTKFENVKGRECQVFSRVVGYYQPVDNWNPGKRQEFEERKLFSPEIK